VLSRFLIFAGLTLELIAFFVMPEFFPTTTEGRRIANIEVLTYMVMQCVLGAALISAGVMMTVSSSISQRLDQITDEVRQSISRIAAAPTKHAANQSSAAQSGNITKTSEITAAPRSAELRPALLPLSDWPETMRPVKEYARSLGWTLEFTGRCWLVARNGTENFQEFLTAEEARRAVGWRSVR
jgi:hypothetical protein